MHPSQPYVYNPEATLGNRWKAVAKANVGRLYHSSATLLPDGSILVSGSNPNADVNNDVKWKTNYDVERFYPEYYDSARPSSKGLPTTLSYGGNKFTITLDSAAQAAKAKVVVIRTGFSTHAMNMGQRMLELRSVAVGNTLHVAQMEPNPNLFAPGPALAFVVVDGVPSHGKFVMVGNGQIGTQPVAAASSLPNAAGKRAEGAEEDGEEIGEQLEEEAMPKEEVPEQHRRGSNAYDRVQRQRL